MIVLERLKDVLLILKLVSSIFIAILNNRSIKRVLVSCFIFFKMKHGLKEKLLQENLYGNIHIDIYSSHFR